VGRPARWVVAAAAVVALLAVSNVALAVASSRVALAWAVAVTAVLLGVAKAAGLSWDDLGLARRSSRRGAVWAGAAVALVAVVYGIGALIPLTRPAFLDTRYDLSAGSALLIVLLFHPIKIVLLEEVAFRGVLLGLLRRPLGGGWAVGLSSVLFGLWHVLPSLRLGETNQLAAAVLGPLPGAQALTVVGAVGFTTLAGVLLCELRRRSGSLLAPMGLHWAVNGLGVLLSALLWSVGG
jgi:uncharacterized protein